MKLLMLFISCCSVAEGSSPLESLIQFAAGGASNPSGRGRPSGTGLPRGPPPPPRRPALPRSVAAPIPFSELADPSRGTVSIDVSQPRQTARQPIQVPGLPPLPARSPIPNPVPAQTQIPDPVPSFAGLPPGAVQIGGRPVSVPRRRKPEPTPLSEINPPIHRVDGFPNPLNEIDPVRAPVFEPVEALSHNFLPGQVPRPIPVPQDTFPLVTTLNDRSIQRLADSNRLNYDRFGDEIFGQIPQGPVFVNSQQRNGEHFIPTPTDFGSQKKDLTHEEALQKHRDEVDKVKKLQQLSSQRQGLPLQQQFQPQQQQFQPPPQQRFQPPPQQFQPPPQQFQPPPQQQFQPPPQQFQPPPQQFQPPPFQQQQQQQASHFNIPGSDTHRQYAQELKLAQDALRSLG